MSQHLRAPRSPNRQVGGHLLRCSAPCFRGRPRIRLRATLPRPPRPRTTLPTAAAYTAGCPSALTHGPPTTRPGSSSFPLPSAPQRLTVHWSRPPQKRPAAEQRPPHQRQRQLEAQHSPGRALHPTNLRPPDCRLTSAKASTPSRAALPQPPGRWARALSSLTGSAPSSAAERLWV